MLSKIIPITVLCLSLYACTCSNDNSNATEEDTATAAIIDNQEAKQENNGTYGAEISPDGALNPAEFLAMMEGKDSLDAKLKGNITACCVKKGCWMDMDLENGTTMKVRFKDYGFFVPLDSEGKNTIVEGRAYLKEIPVDELQHYAEDAGKSQEEIDAITESELAYTFIADGVIITE